jgi:two-component system response regulator
MSENILLIEDRPLDAELTVHALRRCGIHNPVVHVHDGDEALGLLRHAEESGTADQIGLILLDVRMPKVDGFGVLKHIRSSPKLQAIPAVVVTALPVESDRVRASLLGASNYLTKAMDLDEFSLLLKISLRPFI